MTSKKTKKNTKKPRAAASPKVVRAADGSRRGLVKTSAASLHDRFVRLCKVYDRDPAPVEGGSGAWALAFNQIAKGWRIEELDADGIVKRLPFGKVAHPAGVMLHVLEQLISAADCAPRRGTEAA